MKNFPVKCFYNDDEDEIYSFYRQGEALIIQPHDSKQYTMNKMTEMELGTMYLIYNKALAASTSDLVSFYKIVVDEEDGSRKWELYYSVAKRGFLYFIRGNVRI